MPHMFVGHVPQTSKVACWIGTYDTTHTIKQNKGNNDDITPPFLVCGDVLPNPYNSCLPQDGRGDKGADYNIGGNDDTGSLALIVMMALVSATSTTLSMRGHLSGNLKGIVPFLKGN